MADDEDSEKPAVVLGEGEPVEGAPLARVSARLMWGIEKSTIEEREGDTVIRTPDGPQELGDVLADVDQPYFATRQEFEDAVEAVIGTGPVPTAGPAETAADAEEPSTPADDDAEPDDDAAADE